MRNKRYILQTFTEAGICIKCRKSGVKNDFDRRPLVQAVYPYCKRCWAQPVMLEIDIQGALDNPLEKP